MNRVPTAFWCIPAAEMLQHLGTAQEGLSSEEARQRLARYGSNLLKPQKRSDVLTLLLAQFKSPIILILFVATGLSFFLSDPVDAFIILAIILVSGVLGYWQEHSAANAASPTSMGGTRRTMIDAKRRFGPNPMMTTGIHRPFTGALAEVASLGA